MLCRDGFLREHLEGIERTTTRAPSHDSGASTPTPQQLAELVARGRANALVAEPLSIGEGTVAYHLTAQFDKTGAYNRATLIVRLLELARA